MVFSCCVLCPYKVERYEKKWGCQFFILFFSFLLRTVVIFKPLWLEPLSLDSLVFGPVRYACLSLQTQWMEKERECVCVRLCDGEKKRQAKKKKARVNIKQATLQMLCESGAHLGSSLFFTSV